MYIMRKLRWSALMVGITNVLVIILGIVLMVMVESTCSRDHVAPFVVVVVVSCVRIVAMIRIAMAQRATALIIVDSQAEMNLTDAVRRERRRRYRRMLWWTRFATVITVVQFLGAAYLFLQVTESIYIDMESNNCVLGLSSSGNKKQHKVLVLFMFIVCFLALVQCFNGSDVLRWRSFYATEDNIWKAHYREVFDHGIREALCCMGRVKYLTVLEEDEVYSVAQLLGDLMTYRASGTGHLELLAGLALLQKSMPSPKFFEESSSVPEERMQEAAIFHPFAEAAYTGLLLDLGRNPISSPCAWLYRQGIFTPWSRNRQPVLEGDNWWRGHARAFLRFVHLKPEVLRKGRVNQGKCKAAYFIVVLHHLKSVVISVRGTETPEDLITDGLCRECDLTSEDLDGLTSGNHIQAGMNEDFLSSSLPHYGHSGVVEAARDLYMQIEGNPKNGGFLSKLLSTGQECDGYNIRIVGHSLGGSIAALLGMRLCHQFPQLHVYAYGPLPCVDLEVADACSDFITSIVYNNEFSSRLSVASILRLRAAAIKALSEDASTDSAMILKLARHFLYLGYCLQNQNSDKLAVPDSSTIAVTNKDRKHRGSFRQPDNASRKQDLENPFCMDMEEDSSDDEAGSIRPQYGFTCTFPFSSPSVNPYEEHVPQFMGAVPSSDNVSSKSIPEMYLPGLIMHIVPVNNNELMPLWKRWRTFDKSCSLRAYIAKREAFKDIVVSPYMFLDHLPWRCYNAIKKVAGDAKYQAPQDEAQMV